MTLEHSFHTELSVWGQVHADPEVWREPILGVWARHGFGEVRSVRVGEPGSHAVFLVNTPDTPKVVKFFAPFWGETVLTERDLLTAVGEWGIVGVPQIYATGDYLWRGYAWPYMVMELIARQRIGDVWEEMDGETRCRVAGQIGAVLQRLHAIEIEQLFAQMPRGKATFGGLYGDWQAFLTAQRANVVARHRGHGMAEHLLAEMPTYIDQLWPLLFDPTILPAAWSLPRRIALVHGDMTDDHPFVAPTPDGDLSLCGLIDFGDARLGHPLYEFVSLLQICLKADGVAKAACMAGYGWPDALENSLVCHAITALALLHQFADFRMLTVRLGGAECVPSLVAFEGIICGE